MVVTDSCCPRWRPLPTLLSSHCLSGSRITRYAEGYRHRESPFLPVKHFCLTPCVLLVATRYLHLSTNNQHRPSRNHVAIAWNPVFKGFLSDFFVPCFSTSFHISYSSPAHNCCSRNANNALVYDSYSCLILPTPRHPHRSGPRSPQVITHTGKHVGASKAGVCLFSMNPPHVPFHDTSLLRGTSSQRLFVSCNAHLVHACSFSLFGFFCTANSDPCTDRTTSCMLFLPLAGAI